MVFKQLLIIVLLHLVCLSVPINAQSFVTDTVVNEGLSREAINIYRNKLGGYNNLYNGIEYIGSYPGTTGHPYFEWDTLQHGFLKYNGVIYPDIGLKYDLVSNQLVLTGKQNLSISLLTKNVSFFSINGHFFINSIQDSITERLPETGFYEVLYSGPTTILAIRKKKVERSSRVEDPFIFKQYNTYYIKKDGAYKPVEDERDLLFLLGEHKNELRTYLRQNKMTFKKEREKSLVKVVTYYDQLKN